VSEDKTYMQENGLAVGAPTLLLLAEYFTLMNIPCTICHYNNSNKDIIMTVYNVA
jgi:hypothetical protein